MRVRWLDEALDDPNASGEFITRDKPEAARRVVSQIADSLRSVRRFPDLGRPGRVVGTRELLAHPYPYLIIYRVVRNELQVLRVLHTARRWPPET